MTSESIIDLPREFVAEIALRKLQEAGVELVEWDTLLYRRMDVPRRLRNFSYLVPDDRLEYASNILASLDLPLSTPSDLQLKTKGDLYAKGRFYRITRSTVAFIITHIVLYPFSIAAFIPSELSKQPPSHLSHSECSDIIVPRPSAVCAFLLRTMTKYPRYSSTRRVLQCDLSELLLYFFFEYTFHDMHKGEEEEWEQEDDARRIAAASLVVRQWCLNEEWRQGEEWIGDVLATFVTGYNLDNVPGPGS